MNSTPPTLPLPPYPSLSSPSPSSIPPADSACNECRRRKARCDRALPECGPCARNKRHCLYERHANSPLTRRHLTDVEEKLRRAERRIRVLEAEARRRPLASGETREKRETEVGSGLEGRVEGEAALAGRVEEDGVEGEEGFAESLESAPADECGFDWDEQRKGEVEDGMASLSVEDRGTGYLGVASGAAMLRLLLVPELRGLGERERERERRGESGGGDGRGEESGEGWVPTPVYEERGIAGIDLDAAIDAYFALFHLSYPLVHEPTFRAQYAQVIPRVDGKGWNALAYMVAAIGVLTTATTLDDTRDTDLFEAAKANITLNSLESGNFTLVQVLILMSNYLQKRDKPNSGYNYLGLALHMAMGLGMHKEFQDWSISCLNMEMRRRVWWTLFNLFSGASVTFGRPLSCPSSGVEVALPLNIDDRDLTHVSTTLPRPRTGLTTHSAVSAQARFHLATNDVYRRLISSPYPSAKELVRLDDRCIETWRQHWLDDEAETVPSKHLLTRKILTWRYRHLRTIMYRPFLVKHTLRQRAYICEADSDVDGRVALDRCLLAAEQLATSVCEYWTIAEHNNMTAWYTLFYAFQSSLILCLTLRYQPDSPSAVTWQTQVEQLLKLMYSISTIKSTGQDCYRIIERLCKDLLPLKCDMPGASTADCLQPITGLNGTQFDDFYSTLWSNGHVSDMDNLMLDEDWAAIMNDFSKDAIIEMDA